MMTDPIADMLTRIRNAALARHDRTEIPASKLKAAGTITAATDNRCMTAIHLERV